MHPFSPQELVLVEDVLRARGLAPLAQQKHADHVAWQVLQEVVESELHCDGPERVEDVTLESFERVMSGPPRDAG